MSYNYHQLYGSNIITLGSLGQRQTVEKNSQVDAKDSHILFDDTVRTSQSPIISHSSPIQTLPPTFPPPPSFDPIYPTRPMVVPPPQHTLTPSSPPLNRPKAFHASSISPSSPSPPARRDSLLSALQNFQLPPKYADALGHSKANLKRTTAAPSSPSESLASPSSGGSISDYVIVRELGRGSFGRVCLVRHRTTGQLYAMKSVRRRQTRFRTPPGRPSDLLIEKEAALLLHIQHPHIVELHQVVEDTVTNTVHFILEYLPGGALMDYVPDTQQFVWSRYAFCDLIAIREYFIQILYALLFLHTHAIAHRDIKPQNLLLRTPYHLKVADLGTAHIGTQRVSDVQGTPAFHPPEVCRGDAPVDPAACDMWALGVTLYCMVYGRLPFTGATRRQLYDAIARDIPPIEPIPSASPDFFSGLTNLLHRLLSKDPASRPTAFQCLQHPWIRSAGPHADVIAREASRWVRLPLYRQTRLRFNLHFSDMPSHLQSHPLVLVPFSGEDSVAATGTFTFHVYVCSPTDEGVWRPTKCHVITFPAARAQDAFPRILAAFAGELARVSGSSFEAAYQLAVQMANVRTLPDSSSSPDPNTDTASPPSPPSLEPLFLQAVLSETPQSSQYPPPIAHVPPPTRDIETTGPSATPHISHTRSNTHDTEALEPEAQDQPVPNTDTHTSNIPTPSQLSHTQRDAISLLCLPIQDDTHSQHTVEMAMRELNALRIQRLGAPVLSHAPGSQTTRPTHHPSPIQVHPQDLALPRLVFEAPKSRTARHRLLLDSTSPDRLSRTLAAAVRHGPTITQSWMHTGLPVISHNPLTTDIQDGHTCIPDHPNLHAKKPTGTVPHARRHTSVSPSPIPTSTWPHIVPLPLSTSDTHSPHSGHTHTSRGHAATVMHWTRAFDVASSHIRLHRTLARLRVRLQPRNSMSSPIPSPMSSHPSQPSRDTSVTAQSGQRDTTTKPLSVPTRPPHPQRKYITLPKQTHSSHSPDDSKTSLLNRPIRTQLPPLAIPNTSSPVPGSGTFPPPSPPTPLGDHPSMMLHIKTSIKQSTNPTIKVSQQISTVELPGLPRLPIPVHPHNPIKMPPRTHSSTTPQSPKHTATTPTPTQPHSPSSPSLLAALHDVATVRTTQIETPSMPRPMHLAAERCRFPPIAPAAPVVRRVVVRHADLVARAARAAVNAGDLSAMFAIQSGMINPVQYLRAHSSHASTPTSTQGHAKHAQAPHAHGQAIPSLRDATPTVASPKQPRAAPAPQTQAGTATQRRSFHSSSRPRRPSTQTRQTPPQPSQTPRPRPSFVAQTHRAKSPTKRQTAEPPQSKSPLHSAPRLETAPHIPKPSLSPAQIIPTGPQSITPTAHTPLSSGALKSNSRRSSLPLSITRGATPSAPSAPHCTHSPTAPQPSNTPTIQQPSRSPTRQQRSRSSTEQSLSPPLTVSHSQSHIPLSSSPTQPHQSSRPSGSHTSSSRTQHPPSRISPLDSHPLHSQTPTFPSPAETFTNTTTDPSFSTPVPRSPSRQFISQTEISQNLEPDTQNPPQPPTHPPQDTATHIRTPSPPPRHPLLVRALASPYHFANSFRSTRFPSSPPHHTLRPLTTTPHKSVPTIPPPYPKATVHPSLELVRLFSSSTSPSPQPQDTHPTTPLPRHTPCTVIALCIALTVPWAAATASVLSARGATPRDAAHRAITIIRTWVPAVEALGRLCASLPRPHPKDRISRIHSEFHRTIKEILTCPCGCTDNVPGPAHHTHTHTAHSPMPTHPIVPRPLLLAFISAMGMLHTHTLPAALRANFPPRTGCAHHATLRDNHCTCRADAHVVLSCAGALLHGLALVPAALPSTESEGVATMMPSPATRRPESSPAPVLSPTQTLLMFCSAFVAVVVGELAPVAPHVPATHARRLVQLCAALGLDITSPSAVRPLTPTEFRELGSLLLSIRDVCARTPRPDVPVPVPVPSTDVPT